MEVRVGWAELDVVRVQPDLRVGFAEFDARKPARDIRIGLAEFDAGIQVRVGVGEFDNGSAVVPPVIAPTRPPSGGGGLTGGHGWPSSRYYNAATRKYDIPVFNVAEEEEELVILQLLMQIAQDEIF